MIATSSVSIVNVNDGATGATGPQGISVTKVVEEYRLSNSSTELTGSGTGYTWSETKPDIPSGKYLWIRERTDLSNNTSSYGTAHCDIVISGLVYDVNQNTQSITSKVWQSDITNSINTYDGSTGAAIRDRVTSVEEDLDGISSQVLNISTSVVDGETVYTSQELSTIKQNATTFQTTVQNTYATKAYADQSEADAKTYADGLNTAMDTRMDAAESTISQNADNIALMVTVNGQTSALTLTQNMLTAMTSQFVVKDPAGSATIISGGQIHANAITTAMLATDAIKSTNYTASIETNSPYSSAGTFLDLSTGNFYTPNFGVQGTGGAYINGEIIGTSGQFGQANIDSYWKIETIYDYDAQAHAALYGVGDPYIQSGYWQISDDKINTQSYVTTAQSSGNLTYYKDVATNTYYDVGMKIPTNFSGYSASDANDVRFQKVFYYGRKYTGNSIPTYDSDWTYFFEVDTDGNIYEGGVKLSDKYASVDGVSGAYLPRTGGTITGNLTVNGTLTATASKATQLATARTIRTNLASTSTASFNGTSDITPGVTGTLGIGNGGTGKTSWTAYGLVYASSSSALSQLAVGTSGQVLTSKGSAAPAWTSQSSLSVGNATKATQDSAGNNIINTYMPIAGGQFTGAVYVADEFSADSAQVGSLVVTGSASFTNSVHATTFTGNLVGKADEATQADKATKDGDGNTISSTYVKLTGDETIAGKKTFTSEVKMTASGTSDISSGILCAFKSNRAQITNFITQNVYTGSSNIIFYKYGSVSSQAPATLTALLTVGSNGVITAGDHFVGNITGNVTGNASTATTLANARTLTIGDTDKTFDGSANVSWSKSEISGNASTSAAGWMSTEDKSKLDSITVTSGGTIVANNIVGSDGISVTTNSTTGIATVKHANTAITAGTTSGTSNTGNVAFGSTVTLPKITYDAYGHITAASTYTFKLPAAPTSVSGNAGTATKFNSSRTIELTGDTTGSASSDGTSGWSIATTTTTLTHKSLDSTTINNTAGTFAFSGTQEPWPGTDWVGLQVGDAYDKFQISANSSSLVFRQNDSGGTNSANWGDWVTILSSANYNTYAPTKTGTGASGTWGISISGNAATATSATSAASATKATQDGDGAVISSTYAKLAGAAFTGAVTGTSFGASSYLAANSGNSGTVGGLALYAADVDNYGLAARQTSNGGVFGYVQGTWAIYNYVNGGTTRGWIWRYGKTTNVAAISGVGNASFAGSVTVGANSDNTSGCEMTYDSTIDAMVFSFR